MAAGDNLATVAAAEVEAAGGATAGGPAVVGASRRMGTLATAVQRGADVVVMLLQQSPALLSAFIDAPTLGEGNTTFQNYDT